jgi:hypothetical protein
MTNLNKYTATSDAIQLRPFEVLVEEWAKLRRQVCAATVLNQDVLMAAEAMLSHLLSICDAVESLTSELLMWSNAAGHQDARHCGLAALCPGASHICHH